MTRNRRSLLPSIVGNIFRHKHQADEPKPRQIDIDNRGAPLELQKCSKFAQLPADILFLFWHYLDKTAKARVVQTCRYLRQLLEASLYIHPSISHFGYRRRARCLHRTLASRPDLIPYIRSYRGPLLPRPIESTIQSPPKRTLLDRIQGRKLVEPVRPHAPPIAETEAFKKAVFIFSKATQFVQLHFTDGHDWATDPTFGPIKAAVSKMSLTQLYLSYSADPTQVLRAQPELEQLVVEWNTWPVGGLDKADIPKLRSLRATLKEASDIVPGRPVQQLDLVFGVKGNDFDAVLFKSLALSTGPIINFSMRIHRAWDDRNARNTLQLTSQNLPDLEVLAITILGAISGQVILEEIPSLQSLRRLVFVSANLTAAPPIARASDQSVDPSRGDTVTRHNTVVNNWEDLFRRLKILCPLLAEVERSPAM